MKTTQYLTEDPHKENEILAITLGSDFDKKIKELRIKWDIDPDEFNEMKQNDNSDELFKKWIGLHENSDVQEDIINLIKEFNLSIEWKDQLWSYLIDDTSWSSVKFDLDGLQLVTHYDDKTWTKKTAFYLKINPRVSIVDIKKAWPTIRKEMGATTKRRKPYKNFRRDYIIYLSYLQGKTISEIDAEIEKIFPGSDMGYGNIKKIVSTFPKRFEIDKSKIKTKLRTRRK